MGRIFGSVAPLTMVCAVLLLAPEDPAHALSKAPRHLQGEEAPPGAGLDAFLNYPFVAEIVLALLISTLLGATIAYHPRTFGRATALEDVDQPKIFIMYAIVGTVVAEVVRAYTDMAFVIFGIGGLLRFRTDVGHARDTGRVILVTVVGLACGLKIYVVAVLATAFGWILIYLLEAHVMLRLTVKGVDASMLVRVAEAYGDTLRKAGCRILSEKKNFLKSQVAFIFRAPGKLDRDRLEETFQGMPKEVQGAVDWEST